MDETHKTDYRVAGMFGGLMFGKLLNKKLQAKKLDECIRISHKNGNYKFHWLKFGVPTLDLPNLSTAKHSCYIRSNLTNFSIYKDF